MASKHWVIRQYDHEVQGGSAIKPLVGVANDGPGDAAVVRPVLDSPQGVVISCGMNPLLRRPRHLSHGQPAPSTKPCGTAWPLAPIRRGSPFWTTSAGATPSDRKRWARWCGPHLACYDLATELGTPFISGKDSLNNEFRPEGADENDLHPPIAVDQCHGPGGRRGELRDDGLEGGRHLGLSGRARRNRRWAVRTSPWFESLDGWPCAAGGSGGCQTPRSPTCIKRHRRRTGACLPRHERGRAGRGRGRNGLRRRAGACKIALGYGSP